jgi:hypothetical protein
VRRSTEVAFEVNATAVRADVKELELPQLVAQRRLGAFGGRGEEAQSASSP